MNNTNLKQHVWVSSPKLGKYKYCKECLLIQNSSNKDSYTCRGMARLTLRKKKDKDVESKP